MALVEYRQDQGNHLSDVRMHDVRSHLTVSQTAKIIVAWRLAVDQIEHIPAWMHRQVPVASFTQLNHGHASAARSGDDEFRTDAQALGEVRRQMAQCVPV